MVKVIFVKPEKNYMLNIKLSNGKSGIFNAKPYLNKGIFKELKNQKYFELVKIAFGGIVWPHEQDFSADTIEYEMQN